MSITVSPDELGVDSRYTTILETCWGGENPVRLKQTRIFESTRHIQGGDSTKRNLLKQMVDIGLLVRDPEGYYQPSESGLEAIADAERRRREAVEGSV